MQANTHDCTFPLLPPSLPLRCTCARAHIQAKECVHSREPHACLPFGRWSKRKRTRRVGARLYSKKGYNYARCALKDEKRVDVGVAQRQEKSVCQGHLLRLEADEKRCSARRQRYVKLTGCWRKGRHVGEALQNLRKRRAVCSPQRGLPEVGASATVLQAVTHAYSRVSNRVEGGCRKGRASVGPELQAGPVKKAARLARPALGLEADHAGSCARDQVLPVKSSNVVPFFPPIWVIGPTLAVEDITPGNEA